MHCVTRNERGLSESIQYAVIVPALMLSTLGIIQAGVWIHGHNVAIRAASAAADTARGTYGTTFGAVDLASKLAVAGGLKDVHVSAVKGPARVDITVTGRAPTIFDVGLGRISESASSPVERATNP
jgi:TadE-like protein